ncbi:MAG: GntR family transcriptional regulator [Oscillospiraceae bacterium]|nr:GntR family transcriptional regulator [Oscillospiraceae bacterium]
MRWDFHNDAPIYAQLMERIERMIVSGALAPGEKLPAVRTFAMEAGVNPNTMQRALAELERNGLIYSQRTSGHFVTDRPEAIAAVRVQLAEEQTARFLQKMSELGYTIEQAAQLVNDRLKQEGRES